MSKPIDVVLPTEFQEGTESTVSRWLKKAGDEVREHEALVEITTDKVTVEISAPTSGVLSEILLQEQAEVRPGAILARITPTLGDVAPALSASEFSSTLQKPIGVESRLSSTAELSPAVKKLAREHGVELSAVQGTGKDGRITAEDVLRAAKTRTGLASGTGTFVPHSQMRLSIAKHMVESALRTAPHVTAIFEADLTLLLEKYGVLKADAAAQGTRLTLTPFFILATSRAMKIVPEVNSRWHSDKLEVFTAHHVGVATAIDDGLVVPVVRDVQNLTLLEIARQLDDVTTRARNHALQLNDVSGGTFTITNHGMSGSLIATPIIHQPQSAILGVGKIEKRVKVVETNGADSIEARSCAYVTLTIDHRVLDGFRANQFLTALVGELESANFALR